MTLVLAFTVFALLCDVQQMVETGFFCLIHRCVAFHPDGHSLFSGAQDSMRVYGWEPVRCYDSFSLGWGKVADIAVSSNQLVSEPCILTSLFS